MKTVREVLTEFWDNMITWDSFQDKKSKKYVIEWCEKFKELKEIALSDIAEIVEREKMQYHLSFCDRFNYADDSCVNTVLCNCGRDSFNSAYDHIAKLFEEKD